MNLITEILLPNGGLELLKDEPIPIELSVNDIKILNSTGKANFSRSFTFPSTPENDKLLNSIYEINARSKFLPNKKVECKILTETVKVMSGFFQLTDIIRNKDKKIIFYKATVYGYGVDLFYSLGDKELTDLDLYEYNHTRNKFNIESSWTSDIGKGIVYPLIDYAAGLSYPAIKSSIPVQLPNMKPAVYVKTLWDKIFSGAGYTVTSTFINSEYFKRLIVPNNSEYLTYAANAIGISNLFKAYKTTDQDIVKAAPTNTTFTVVQNSIGSFIRTAFDDDGANIGNDPGNNFTTTPLFGTPYTYFVPSSDDYSFHVQITAGYSAGNSGVNGVVDVTIERDSTGAGVSQQTIGSSAMTLTVTQTGTVHAYANNISLLQGDKIYIRTRFTTGPTAGAQTLKIYGGNQSYFECTNSGTLGQVSSIGYVDIATNLPPKVKQKDFINSMIKMFNLYIEPIGNRHLLIEPRDDFYTLGKRKNWTEKLDISKPIQIKLLSELKNHGLNFTWQSDNDFLNSDYTSQTSKVYGDYKIEYDNDFLTSSETIQPIFAPTPLDNIDGSTSIIIPRIYSKDDKGEVNKVGGKIRILYYGGLVDIAPFNEKWSLDYSPVAYQGFSVTTYSTYPYAGHLSNPYNPDGATDLTWHSPDYIYYVNPTTGRSGYTSNGLYERFYKKSIEEISNPNSKLVTAYFNLTPTDISTLSFKDIYFVDDVYYRLNKVEYNALGTDLARVELLKLITSKVPLASIQISPKRIRNSPNLGANYGSNKTASFSSTFGINNSIADDTLFSSAYGIENNIYSGSSTSSVFGTRNNLYFTSGATINGDNNIVNQGSNILISGGFNTADTVSNAAIIGGSGNTFTSGSTGVVMLGVNNYNGVTENNTTYVTYLNVLSGFSISGTSVVTDGANVGTGAGQVFSGKTGSTLNLRTLSGISNVLIATLPTVVNIGVTTEPVFSSVTASMFYSGSTNLYQVINNAVSGVTALNVGSGSGVIYSAKTGNTFLFKTLSAQTPNLVLTTGATVNTFGLNSNISLTSISGVTLFSGATNLNSIFAVSGVNLSAPNNVFKQKTGQNLEFRSLVSGSHISLSESATAITITNILQPRNVCTEFNYTIDKGDWLVVVDKNSTPVTITLPASPTDNQEFVIKDNGNASSLNVTLDGNGHSIDGSSTYVMNVSYQSTSIVYSSCAERYLIVYDYRPYGEA